MLTSTSNSDHAGLRAADLLIPVIRTAATIGFAIAPCSLGFVIIAASEQLIHSIMVGDDPEMLMSALQNEFPNETIEIIEDHDAGLISKVVDMIERRRGRHDLPVDAGALEIYSRKRGAGNEILELSVP